MFFQDRKKLVSDGDPIKFKGTVFALPGVEPNLAPFQVDIFPFQREHLVPPGGEIQVAHQHASILIRFSSLANFPKILNGWNVPRVPLFWKSFDIERILAGEAFKVRLAPPPGGNQIFPVLVDGVSAASFRKNGEVFKDFALGQNGNGLIWGDGTEEGTESMR